MYIATTTVTTICSYYSDGPLFDVLEQYHIPPPTAPTQNGLGITNILLASYQLQSRKVYQLPEGWHLLEVCQLPEGWHLLEIYQLPERWHLLE